MSGDWREPIARIWGPDGAVGTGCLIQTPQDGVCLLTAAHVVNEALSRADDPRGPYFQAAAAEGELIAFDLPFRTTARRHAARLIEWHPARPSGKAGNGSVEDVALLKVLGVGDGAEYPSLPTSLRIFSPEELEVLEPKELQRRAQVLSFGFSRTEGAVAAGRVTFEDGAGRLHLAGESDHGDFISPGFSGAPVFMGRRIIGMALSADADHGKRLAFLQSTFNLWRACPQLARPYRGLRSFDEEDAPFFFGRDAFVAQMLAKLARHPLVGATAASGSGKSSAIRAGLIPKLRVDGRTLILVMRPESHPWKQLALHLCRLEDPDALVLTLDDRAHDRARMLRENPDKLPDYAAHLLKQHDADRLLIVVDQFEELFTLAGHDRQSVVGGGQTEVARQPDDGEGRVRPDFRDLMVASANLDPRNGRPQIQWLFALRGDFADRAFRHRGFADRVGDGNVFLADMTDTELHCAVSEPAARLGVRFEGGTDREPGLAERIVRDGGHKRGSLPLVQHLLAELWRGMRGRLLTHVAYQDLGKVEGALERHAERVFDALSPEQQALLPRLFSRLVNVKDDGEATRRLARRSELKAELWALAERLAEEDSRILILSSSEGGTGTPDPAAEVGHEALLRHWSKLRDWVRADQRFLLWRQGFEQRLHEHAAARDKAGTWLAGAPLQRAVDYYDERPNDFSEEEADFVVGSKIQREIEEKYIERHQIILKKYLIAASVMAFLLLFTSVGVAILYRKADRQTEAAQARGAELEQARRTAEDEASRYAAAVGAQMLAQGKLIEALKIVRPTLGQQFTSEAFNRKPAAWSSLAQAVGALEDTPGTLRGHNDQVVAATFSPDGRRIITASRDGTARIWDSVSGRMIHSLEGHTGPVMSAAFSLDGQRVITASRDSTARIWDSASGRFIHSLEGHASWVNSAAFSADGERVVTASWDGTARIWDSASGDRLHVLEQHAGWVNSAAFSSDGQLVVTASWDGTARIWSSASGHPIHVLEGHRSRVNSAKFSTDGQRVATASLDGTARIWDTVSGDLIHTLERHTASVNSAAFSLDGQRIVTASDDKTARIWDSGTGDLLHSLEGHIEPVNSAAFSLDGHKVVTASGDKTVRVWDSVAGHHIHTLEGHSGPLSSAAFSTDAQRVITASHDKTARIWDTTTGSQIHALEGHTSWVYSASFSPDGKQVVTVSNDKTARIWDSATGRQIHALEGHTSWVNSATFSGDGRRVVTAYMNGTAGVWDSATGLILHSIEGHTEPVNSATVSQYGQQKVTASSDNSALILDRANGRLIHALKGHTGTVNSVAFSPDGQRVVTASDDRTARIWDRASGRLIQVLEGHKDRVISAAFSPDGQRVITASWDNTARIWNVLPASLERRADGTIKWTVEAPFSQALLDRADQIVPHKLTEQERREILKEDTAKPLEMDAEDQKQDISTER